MYDFPALLHFAQHDSPSINEPNSVVEMEGRNCHFVKGLYPQFAWLDIHVRSSRLAATYLFEHRLKCLLVFRTTVRAFRYRTRIKHSGFVVERKSELLPIQVIEGPNEPRECLADPCLRSFS